MSLKRRVFSSETNWAKTSLLVKVSATDKSNLISTRVKKIFILSILTLTSLFNLYAQFNYVPPKPENVAESEYRRGRIMLQNSYAQAKNGIVAIDYWNIAMAYLTMGQSGDTINNFLIKSRTIDESGFCKIALYYDKTHDGIENTNFYKILGESYRALVSDCETVVKATETKRTSEVKSGLNEKLVSELKEIAKLDQTDRFNPGIQNPIDQSNIKRVEAIIKKYGYPGRKLVGEEYESVAWLIIQHAELSYQEKYLPLIHKAVIEDQLDKVPLKMLIDRIYFKKSGLQIFGSQAGVDFASDKIIAEVKIKYSLN